MTDFILALALVLMGMAGLAVGMARHYQRVWGGEPLPGALRRYRQTGWCLLLAGLLPCLTGWGVSMGIIVWTGLLTPALLIVAITLAAKEGG